MANELIQFFVELIGTFIFLSVIIITGNPLAIGLTLAAVIWFGGSVSGGHFNPAVNLLMLLNKKINIQNFIIQIIAQLLGATLAFYYYTLIKKK
jgi:aquaporin Z|tara:strand:+ start:2902 stop:3183 length:282 start_codon:yes stop_codon:yes gene_type:complete